MEEIQRGLVFHYSVYTMDPVFVNSGDDFGSSEWSIRQKWWIVYLDTRINQGLLVEDYTLLEDVIWRYFDIHEQREYIKYKIRFLERFIYKSFQPNRIDETVSINGWPSLHYISFPILSVLFLVTLFEAVSSISPSPEQGVART